MTENNFLLYKFALQILPIVITPVCRCVFMYVYVRVLPVCVSVCSQVGKILKYSTIEHFQQNGASSVFLLLDPDLHFQGKSVGILLEYLVKGKR